MRILYWLFAVMMLAGCGKNLTVPTESGGTVLVKEAALTDKQKIQLLRDEAHKRKMHWSITCSLMGTKPDEEFIGFAYPEGNNDSGIYAEDGVKEHWGEFGATQAGAAYNLYLSIQQSPNMHPDHAPKYVREGKKMCPPELRGN